MSGWMPEGVTAAVDSVVLNKNSLLDEYPIAGISLCFYDASENEYIPEYPVYTELSFASISDAFDSGDELYAYVEAKSSTDDSVYLIDSYYSVNDTLCLTLNDTTPYVVFAVKPNVSTETVDDAAAVRALMYTA